MADVNVECLERLKRNYVQLYDQYIATADKLATLTKTFIRLFNNVTIVINPAIYNNTWTAWYYRQWFFRDLREILDIWAILTETSGSNAVLTALQHSSKHLGLDDEIDSYKSWENILKRFDPENKYLAWWTSDKAVASIQRLRGLLGTLQTRISEWYDLSYWRNRGDQAHKEEFEKLYTEVHEAFDLIKPDELFACEVENLDKLVQDEEEILKLKEQLKQLKDEKSKLEERILVLQQELKKCTESKKDDVSADRVHVLQAQLDSVTQEIVHLRESEKTAREKLREVEIKNIEFEKNLTAKTAELAGANAKLLLKTEELDEIKKKFDEYQKESKEELDDWKLRYEELDGLYHNCLTDKKLLEGPKNNEEQAELIKTLQHQLTVCKENLDRANKDYRDLEAENTENKNLAALYKQESENLKRFFTVDPIEANNATPKQKREGAVGIGKNFEYLFRNSENIRYAISSIIMDYKNRVRSDKQNIANLGWFWNYLIDDSITLLKPYITEKEEWYIKNRKISTTQLGNIYQ